MEINRTIHGAGLSCRGADRHQRQHRGQKPDGPVGGVRYQAGGIRLFHLLTAAGFFPDFPGRAAATAGAAASSLPFEDLDEITENKHHCQQQDDSKNDIIHDLISPVDGFLFYSLDKQRPDLIGEDRESKCQRGIKHHGKGTPFPGSRLPGNTDHGDEAGSIEDGKDDEAQCR